MAEVSLQNFSDLVARVDDLDTDATGLRNCTTTRVGNTITEIEDSGKKKVTTLNTDGSVTEKFYSETNVLIITKTTTRNPDGSIRESLT